MFLKIIISNNLLIDRKITHNNLQGTAYKINYIIRICRIFKKKKTLFQRNNKKSDFKYYRKPIILTFKIKI